MGFITDSRSGGIPYITAAKINASSWKLRYASNRGGKGEVYSDAQLSRFADTIISDEFVNDSGSVKDFYKYDDILRGVENDRDLQVQDISGKIDDLIASGYTPDSAIIKNYKESYAGVGHTYERKIKKRKKQLQVAALFGPFGVTTSGDVRGEGLFFRKDAPQEENAVENVCGSNRSWSLLLYSENNQGFGQR